MFGDDVNSAQAQFYKQQLLINESLRQYNDIGKDAFKGIAQDLLAGKSAMEALSGALNKIASKLIDMAADNLWSSAFGGKGGGGFNIGSLFGFGGGSSSPTWSSGLGAGTGGLSFPMFANGTQSAPGGMAWVGERGKELVNLPRGSEVIPNHELPNAMGGTTVSVAGSTVVIQGDASEKTIALIKQALSQHDAALPAKVVTAVREARKTRQLT